MTWEPGQPRPTHRPLSWYALVTINKNFRSRPKRLKYSKCMNFILSGLDLKFSCLWSLGHIMKVVYCDTHPGILGQHGQPGSCNQPLSLGEHVAAKLENSRYFAKSPGSSPRPVLRFLRWGSQSFIWIILRYLRFLQYICDICNFCDICSLSAIFAIFAIALRGQAKNSTDLRDICVRSDKLSQTPLKVLLKTPLGNFFFRRSGKTFQTYLHRRSIFNIITKNILKENKIQPWFSVLERF